MTDSGPDKLNFKGHRAYIVGIDAYRHVSPLRTAVNDAQRLATILQSDHRFTVTVLQDPGGAELRQLLHTTMAQQVGKDDRVLFYFAGHGVAHDGEDGPAGYLVPVDAEPTDLKTFIPMAELQAALDALPCRHLLVILDCCFSGAFKWSSQTRAIGTLMPSRIYEQRFARFMNDAARQIITSAAYDQKALDVLHGKPTGDRGQEGETGHSPFALALFDGLSGAADVTRERESDGVITATEMYCSIRDRIEPSTLQEGQRLRQTPSFFPLKGHDKGEFMFLDPHSRLNLPKLDPKDSPFKGLESFSEADKHLFYGRDRVVAALRKKADDPACRLLVVAGASGTGKSSVIKAGLLPLLREAGLTILPVMRPGAHPMAALDEALKQATAPAVLIIDQFEEVITRCADPAERAAFDARVRELIDAGDKVARLIITVRSDFEPQLNVGALKEAWARGRFTVPPFSLDELREVVVMPTIQGSIIFNPPELADKIVGEVVQSPGALPLLSYALSELFIASQKRGGAERDLSEADYTQIGGVMGALRTKADALYRDLASDEERDIMRKILLRMVSVEGDLAGRRVPMADLAYADVDAQRVDTVIEQLVNARLVVRGKDNIEASDGSARSEDYVEPGHDALVRAWSALHEWIHAAGKDKLILAGQLNAAARAFDGSGNVEYLWHSNPNLPVVEGELKDRRRCWFNKKEVDFIRASVRRKTHGTRVWRATAATVFATVTGLGAYGWVKQQQATGTITEARGFTDDLMFDVIGKLRGIDKTETVRAAVVERVGALSKTLSQVGGAQRDPSTEFWTHIHQGDADLDRKQFDAARERYRQAQGIANNMLQDPNWLRNLSYSHGKLGELALMEDANKPADFAAARQSYHKALEIDQRLVRLMEGSKKQGMDLLLHDVFVSHYRLGDLERREAQAITSEQGADRAKQHRLEARRAYEQALGIAERLTNEAADKAQARRGLVNTLIELGNVAYDLADEPKHPEGLHAHERFAAAVASAERWSEDVLRDDSMQAVLGTTYGRLAFLKSGTGRIDEARSAVNRALAIVEPPAAPGPKEPDPKDTERKLERLATYKTLGVIEGQAGDLPAARRATEKALQIARRELDTRPDDADWQHELVAALVQIGDLELQAQRVQAARTAFMQARKAARSDEDRQLASKRIASLPRAHKRK